MHKTALVTAAAELPVTFAEAKEHLRIIGDDEDAHITTLLRTAIESGERTFRRRFVNSTWDLFLDAFPTVIKLPWPPLSSVTSIKWVDKDDAATTIATTVYRVDTNAEPGEIVLRQDQSWPGMTDQRETSPIEVRFVAGYGADWNSVPRNIRHWLKLEIARLYEDREPTLVGTSSKELPAQERLRWLEQAEWRP